MDQATHNKIVSFIWGMKPKKAAPVKQTKATIPQVRDIGGLLSDLREVIQTARQHALRAVDVVQVRTCWSVGRHIVEFEL